MFRPSRAFRLRQQLPPFRLQRAQRSFWSKSRYSSNGEPIQYQAVRFKEPRGWKQAVTFGLQVGLFYGAYTYVSRFLDIKVEEIDDAHFVDYENLKKKDKEKEEEAEQQGEGPYYADEENTFIPMTWSTKLPRTFYKGTDPEWQEFLKVAKDAPRTKAIQDELVQVVYKGTQMHPGVTKNIGNEAKIGKYWLEITFPDAPPQEYERSGLEFGDGFIAWSQQKVSAEQQWRTDRAMWPQATAEGVWATIKVLSSIQYRRAKQALGWEDSGPLTPEARFAHAMEVMAKQQQAAPGKRVGPLSDPDGVSSPPTTATEAVSGAHPRTQSEDRIPWTINIPLPSVSAIKTQDLPIAMHVFQANLSKKWNPKTMEPPRGAFMVSGLVEVRGQRGRILFDVKSCYDPKQSKFVRVDAAVRNVKRWRQGPKGGS